jgi:cytochrome P450 family 103
MTGASLNTPCKGPQWSADLALMPAAVAEATRLEPSVASQDIEVDGAILREGAYVTSSTTPVLRDEAVYDHRDVFDIGGGKRPRIHPIFGSGVHRCIGETPAATELEESLTALTQRIPQLRLDWALVIRGVSGIRHVDTMLASRGGCKSRNKPWRFAD